MGGDETMPEPIHGNAVIDVDEKFMTAHVVVNEPQFGGRPYTYEMLLPMVAVRYGVSLSKLYEEVPTYKKLDKMFPDYAHFVSESLPVCAKLTPVREGPLEVIRKLKQGVDINKLLILCQMNTGLVTVKKDDKITSNNGPTIIDKILICPSTKAFATPNDIENNTKPTASSKATTGNNTFVTGPFALYCLTTIKVAAGAVAEAIAPIIIAAGSGNFSGINRYTPTKTISTIIVVNTAWKIPIIVACFPMVLSCESLNSLPIEKAMKPNATSDINPKPLSN